MHTQSTCDTAEKEEIAITLKYMVVEILNLASSPDQIEDSADLHELGLDSMSVIDLVLATENRLNISIPEEKLSTEIFANLSLLVDLIAELKRL